jgi:hypothetical protein
VTEADWVTLPDGVTDADGDTLLEGVTLLDGVTDEDGVTLLEGVTLLDGVTMLVTVALPVDVMLALRDVVAVLEPLGSGLPVSVALGLADACTNEGIAESVRMVCKVNAPLAVLARTTAQRLLQFLFPCRCWKAARTVALTDPGSCKDRRVSPCSSVACRPA